MLCFTHRSAVLSMGWHKLWCRLHAGCMHKKQPDFASPPYTNTVCPDIIAGYRDDDHLTSPSYTSPISSFERLQSSLVFRRSSYVCLILCVDLDCLPTSSAPVAKRQSRRQSQSRSIVYSSFLIEAVAESSDL